MKQKDLKKFNRLYKIFIVLMIIFSFFLIGTAIIIGLTSAAEEGWVKNTFIAATSICAVANIGVAVLVIGFYRLDKKFFKILNEAVNPAFKVIQNIHYDVLDAAWLRVKKRENFIYKIGFLGKVEDIEFEYYHLKVEKKPFLNKNIGFIDVFVFKNIEGYQQNIVISTGEETTITEDYKKFKMSGYFIYAKNEENWEGVTLPKDAFYFSIVDQTAYLILATEEKEFSKPYYFKSIEDFKVAFDSKLNQTINLYEEIKTWLK